MSKEAKENPQESTGLSVDLSSLSDLSFGPTWAGDKLGSKDGYRDYEADGPSRCDGKKRSRSGGRDRRSGGRPQRKGFGGKDTAGTERGADRDRPQGGDRSRYGRREGGDDRRGSRQRDMAPPFEPTVSVDLYPQDEAFDALVSRLTATARTYQLFEIVQLVLEKPERYIVVVTNKAKDGAEAAPLYFAVPGHLPFETEEAAINHVLSEHLDHFFTIESVELDPPKGSFQVVNRCGLTGELLGPPNYHRYQEFVQRHFNNRIHNMSFDRFQSKIETVKEQESIDAWMESMKKGERYIVKERAEGEPEALSTLEEVRLFLIQHRKDQVVGSSTSVRFAGRDIERMPRGDLRRSVEIYCEQQKRFPLDSANNLRGRLRRHNFTVYKKGSKGVTYVCSVKRKFRDESTVFSDSIQSLMTFIEANQEISATQLPEAYLGMDAAKLVASKPKAPTAEAPEAPEAEAEAVEAPEPEASPETPAAASPAVESETASTAPELTAEEKKRLHALMVDLRWLVREGYVTEYGDGRLFASGIIPKPKKKVVKKEPVAEAGNAGNAGEAGDVAVVEPAAEAIAEPVAEPEVEAPTEAVVEIVPEETAEAASEPASVEPEVEAAPTVESEAATAEPAETIEAVETLESAETLESVEAVETEAEVAEATTDALSETDEAEEKPKAAETDEA